MRAEATTKTQHLVLVEMTAEEARGLAQSATAGADCLRYEADRLTTPDEGDFDAQLARQQANRLEVFASALGIALAQLPKEGE